MGKNAKIIIFSLIALAVLGGVAALLILTAPVKEEKTDDSEFKEPVTASDSADLTLCNRQKDEVSRIDVTNENGGFTIVPSGNTDGNGDIIWSVEGVGDAPLDSAAVTKIVGFASSVDARDLAEKITDKASLEKYGLDKPRAVVKTTFTDGTSFEFRIGKDVPSISTAAYMTADDETIYTAYKSRSDALLESRYVLVSTAVTPEYDQSGSEDIEKLTVERPDLDQPIVIEKLPSKGEEAVYNLFSHKMISPYNAYIDLTDGTKFLYSIFGVSATSVANVGASEEELSEAGMDEPSCKITAVTNVKTYTLTLGKGVYEDVTGDDGNVRSILQGYYGVSSEHPGILYFFAAGTIEAATVEPSKVLSKMFVMPYILSLESFTYTDSTHSPVEVKIEQIPAASEDEEAVENYYVNGEKWDTKQVKSLYQYLISAAGEEVYLDDAKGDLIAEVTYNYIDKSDGVDGKEVVRFYTSGTDRKVIINVNGTNLFKTRQLYVTQLEDNITAFLEGGEIISTY